MSKPFHNIPQTLRNRPQWVLWRLVERDGKPTKVPFTPAGTPASVSDPNTWTDFETALRAYRQGNFDGIGFVLTADTGVVCVDIDHARNCTSWKPEALEIVRQLDTYTEVSPSGDGLHVWIIGKMPNGRRRNGKIEMYDSGRFITITGQHLDGTPMELMERTAEIAELHRRIFGATAPDPTPTPTEPLAPDDEEIIQRAMLAQNGEKFRALWNGDTSGYPSQSEADLALCRMLAFWCGNDPARIERLFSQSALGQREKWRTRVDYRQQTIQTALQTLHETYSANGNGHRQIPRQLRQNPATDANHNGADNQPGKFAERATDQPGAAADTPRKPTRPAPRPWPVPPPPESADTVGIGVGWAGSSDGGSLAGEAAAEAAPTVLAAYEDSYFGPAPGNRPEYKEYKEYACVKASPDRHNLSPDRHNVSPDRRNHVPRSPQVVRATNLGSRGGAAGLVLEFASRRGEFSVADLQRELGLSRDSAWRAVDRLVREGLLFRVGYGVYSERRPSLSASVVSISEYAQRCGVSEQAAKKRLQRLCRTGLASRVAPGAYELLPSDWRRVRVRVAESLYLPNKHDRRGVSSCFHVQFVSPDGKIHARFIANEDSGKLRSLLEAAGIGDPFDLEGAELDISVRLVRERTRSGWASYYVVVGIWRGDRLVWRERERDKE